jgi:hypothetical protein
MEKKCVQCGREVGGNDPDTSAMLSMTHGLCEPCASKSLSESRESIGQFLDRLGVPVLLIESGPSVFTGNRYAREILGKALPDIENHRGGEVIECVNSKTPEGCGFNVHCKSCTIRNTVLDTFATGKSHTSVSAYPDIDTPSGVKTMRYQISTVKVGDFVMLRIDDIREKAAS